MSKPIPNSPHTRMRFTVFGAAPSQGRTNGAAMSAAAVSAATSSGRRGLSIRSTLIDVIPRHGPAQPGRARTLGVWGPFRGPQNDQGRSFAPDRAEESARAHHEDERHGGEEHHVGVAGVHHRGQADDLAGDETAE